MLRGCMWELGQWAWTVAHCDRLLLLFRGRIKSDVSHVQFSLDKVGPALWVIGERRCAENGFKRVKGDVSLCEEFLRLHP